MASGPPSSSSSTPSSSPLRSRVADGNRQGILAMERVVENREKISQGGEMKRRRIHHLKIGGDDIDDDDDDDDDYVSMRDSYKSPYDDDEGESFRVYVKGIVIEERVKDATIAGIGVAIFHYNNNNKGDQIFEMRKPLVVGKKLMSSDEVGLRALIEGLNGALYLDLKRVTCFSDDYTIHRYVMEGLEPPESLCKLVQDVMLLKTKFAQFSLALVEGNRMVYALKLAREATLLLQNWRSLMDGLRKTMVETCIICLEVLSSEKMFLVDGCFHRFCLSCMKQHAETKLRSWTPVDCPGVGCKTELNINECGKFLDPEKIDIMKQRKKEASIPANERVYCPYPKCSFLMSKAEVLEYTNKCHDSGGGGARKCMKCLSYLCVDCKAPWHYGMDCKEFKASDAYRLTGDGKLHTLACEKRWRQCGYCNNMVELLHGCNCRVNCRCGHKFCFRCGTDWKYETCRCPPWFDYEEPVVIEIDVDGNYGYY